MSEIRSYRRVFDLERRIYSVDRLRLNPGGVPVRGLVYFLLLTLAAMLTGAAPLGSAAARHIPWFVRDIVVPGACAAFLSVVRIEGRCFHVAAAAIVRHLATGRVIEGLQRRGVRVDWWTPWEVVLLPDGSEHPLRRLSYRGPGAVLVAVEHDLNAPAAGAGGGGKRRPGRRTLVLRGRTEGRRLTRAKVVVLESRARLRVAPARRSNPRA